MIHYVIACYLGDRRYNIYNENSMVLRKHLESVSKFIYGISKITVVLNYNDIDEVRNAEEIVKEFKHLPIHFMSRENVGYSYAAWEHAVISSIGDDTEFYVLIEDDYVPAMTKFYQPFIDKLKDDDNLAYVCSVVLPSGGKRHCAISNGVLKKSLAKDVIIRTGKLFTIAGGGGYHNAEETQLNLLDNIEKCGYMFDEVGLEFCHEFSDSKNKIFLGNESGKKLIVPLMGTE